MAKKTAKKTLKKAVKKNSSKKGNYKLTKFMWIYFIFLIVDSLFAIIDSIFITGKMEVLGDIPGAYSLLASLFTFVIFGMSIAVIVLYIIKKMPRITLVMPIFYMVMFIIVFVHGISMGVMSAIRGIPVEMLPITTGLIVFSIVVSIIQLVLTGYIINKLR